MEEPQLGTIQDFMGLWMKTYQATYGRLVEMPPVGPLRERYKTDLNNINTSMNLYNSWMEMMANFQVVFVEGMRRLRIKMDEIDNGVEVDNLYDEIYKLWIETLSETFQEFLKTEHFSTEMGKFMSLFIDFQKANQDWLEQNLLKPMNLPTRTEMNEANKRIYNLKKEIKKLTLKLESKAEK